MGLVLYAVSTCVAAVLVPMIRSGRRQARSDRAAWARWRDSGDAASRKAAARDLSLSAVARYARTDEICDELLDDLTRFG
jgi:membrane protein required for beta-lactamase induction